MQGRRTSTRRTRRVGHSLLALATIASTVVILTISGPLPASADVRSVVQRVSRNGGFEIRNHDVTADAVSGDGRYVAMQTDAQGDQFGLDPDDANDDLDIYVRDNDSELMTLISQFLPDGNGVSDTVDDDSFDPVISADGRYVAFISSMPYQSENYSDFNDVTSEFLSGPNYEPFGMIDPGDGGQGLFWVDRGPADADGNYATQFCYETDDVEPCMATPQLISIVGAEGGDFIDMSSSFVHADPFAPSMSADGFQIAFGVQFLNDSDTDPSTDTVAVVDLDADGDGQPLEDLDTDFRSTVMGTFITTGGFDTDDVGQEQYRPAMSADGDHVAFHWHGDDDQHGGASLVSVYDRDVDGDGIRDEVDSGGTRVTLATTDAFTRLRPFGEGDVIVRNDTLLYTASGLAGISGDGLTVAYSFFYDNPDFGVDSIVSPLPQDVPQIVVVDRDPTTGEVIPGSERVISGIGPPTDRSYGQEASVFPVVSDDGRYVAFDTAADIADVEVNAGSDGCPQDRRGFGFPEPEPPPVPRTVFSAGAAAQATGGTGQCHVVAVDLAQELDNNFSPKLVDTEGLNPADGPAEEPDISTDGRFITFTSIATNLDSTESNGAPEPSNELRDDVYELEWTPQLVATPDPTILPETPVGGTVVGPTRITIDTPDFGPYRIGDVTLLGQHDQDFTIDSLACQGITFHQGQPCQLTVRFTPTAIGTREADVVVNRSSLFFSSSLGAVVEVTGVGTIPEAVGATERVSLGSPGNDFTDELPSGSFDPDLSANGRFVAFEADIDIAPNDQDFDTDIYVRDLLLGTTTLVSARADGTLPGGGTLLINPDSSVRQPQSASGFTTDFAEPSYNPAISGDGRYIVYQSRDRKTNEDGDTSTNSFDIWLADRGAPGADGGFTAPITVHLVSVFSSGNSNVTSLDDNQVDPSISVDGTQVAWSCEFLDFSCNGDFEFGEFDDTVLVRDLDIDGDGVPEGPLDSRTEVVRPDDQFTRDERQARISADGDHIAFVADTALTFEGEGVSSSADEIWVYDRDLDGDGRREETAADSGYQVVTTSQFTSQTFNGDDRTVFPGALSGTYSFDPAIDGDGSSISYSFGFDDDSIGSQLPYDIPQVLVADRAVTNGAVTSTEVVSAAGPLEDIQFFEPDNCTQIPGPGPTVILDPPDPDTCTNVGDGPSIQSDISNDGRYVTFATGARNLHVDDNAIGVRDTCGRPGFGEGGDPERATCDVLVADRLAPGNAGSPQLVHPVVTGPNQPDLFPTGESVRPSISGDGRVIVFQSAADNLLGTFDDPTPESGQICPCPIDGNFADDIYLREWDPTSQANAVQLSFPSTGIGQTSAAQSVRVDTDQFGPDPVLQASITGGNAGDFVITGSSNCLPPLADAPVAPVAPVPDYAIIHLDTQCTISVAFRPTAFGTRSSTLTIRTGGAPRTLFEAQSMNVRLVGGGAGTGGFTVDPVAIDFGEQLVTVTSPQQTVTVTNTGSGPFRINSVTIVGTNAGDYTIVSTDCTGRLLQPTETCKVTLVFKPSVPGESTATLRFDDDAPGNPHLVQLLGRAPVGTILVNPAVTQTARTVTVQGDKWAPNSTVVLTMVDRINPAVTFPETLTVTTDANGRFLARILVFPRSQTGPRLVQAQGQPAAMTASDDLLVTLPTVEGPDFVIRS